MDDKALKSTIDELYRCESRRVLATLIRLLGSFDLAEEALHEAFAAATEQWPAQGLPGNPRAWLVSTGRFKAIDSIRRRARFDEHMRDVADTLNGNLTHSLDGREADPIDEHSVEDDHLRLIFTCCHPALSPDSRVALTLRTVCDLTTEEIARAFLSTAPTIAQRIVRAKSKIRDAGIPYEVPETSELPQRLDSVLRVIYLVFNEGYSASSGDSLLRERLSQEAIRLARLLLALTPDAEVRGLLALMLLHEARRPARTTASGELVLLEDQDRSQWDRDLIDEGIALLTKALPSPRAGHYTLQAGIAAVHADADDFASTDWAQIVGFYDLLLRLEVSPVLELNRAAAIAMREGPEAGLNLIEAILARGELEDYQPAHAARADLYRRLGRTDEARAAYKRALSLTGEQTQQRFLQQRLATLGDKSA